MDTPGRASRAASDCGLGLEGIVKRIRSRYESGRTRAWLKIKVRAALILGSAVLRSVCLAGYTLMRNAE